LSRLYRVVSLAKAVGLSVAELRTLTVLANANPLLGDSTTAATPASTLDFLDVFERFRAAKATVAEVAYLLRHLTPQGSALAPSTTTVTGWIKETGAILTKAVESAKGIVDADGTLCESLMEELEVPQTTISEILLTIRGASLSSTSAQWSTLIQPALGF